MNCYFHPQAEGVVNCGKCGVAMCKECEQNAFFRLDGGTGQALCNRCSLSEAQENVNFESQWLKKRKVKIIFMAVFVFVGAIAFLSSQNENGLGVLLGCWFVSGLISNIGSQKAPQSVKSQVKDVINEYRYPISTIIGKIIGTTFFAPFILLANLIGYFRTKSAYKKDLQVLETIKEIIKD